MQRDADAAADAPKPRRLILFDLDGTLLDSREPILGAQARAFAALGLPAPAPERSLAVVGLSLSEAFTALVGADGPIEGLRHAYTEAWTAMRAAPGYRELLYPGAAETVAALAARPGILLGIATGKSRRGVDRLLAARGWATTFATIQTADDHPSKPHPSMIRAALAETGVPAQACVMVGDTTFDMAMAKAAGVTPLAVGWGFHDVAALRAVGAAACVETFGALSAFLDGRQGESRHGEAVPST